jgi:hypothetical protein
MNELPKSLQLDDEGYICDERGILVEDNPDFMRVMVARYNAHMALRLVYDEVQRLRGMGYTYTTRVVEALDKCEVALELS